MPATMRIHPCLTPCVLTPATKCTLPGITCTHADPTPPVAVCRADPAYAARLVCCGLQLRGRPGLVAQRGDDLQRLGLELRLEAAHVRPEEPLQVLAPPPRLDEPQPAAPRRADQRGARRRAPSLRRALSARPEPAARVACRQQRALPEQQCAQRLLALRARAARLAHPRVQYAAGAAMLPVAHRAAQARGALLHLAPRVPGWGAASGYGQGGSWGEGLGVRVRARARARARVASGALLVPRVQLPRRHHVELPPVLARAKEFDELGRTRLVVGLVALPPPREYDMLQPRLAAAHHVLDAHDLHPLPREHRAYRVQALAARHVLERAEYLPAAAVISTHRVPPRREDPRRQLVAPAVDAFTRGLEIGLVHLICRPVHLLREPHQRLQQYTQQLLEPRVERREAYNLAKVDLARAGLVEALLQAAPAHRRAYARRPQ
eukprot:scaffold59230_cov75-Phaeocystis_antarctica.AAC.1